MPKLQFNSTQSSLYEHFDDYLDGMERTYQLCSTTITMSRAFKVMEPEIYEVGFKVWLSNKLSAGEIIADDYTNNYAVVV